MSGVQIPEGSEILKCFTIYKETGKLINVLVIWKVDEEFSVLELSNKHFLNANVVKITFVTINARYNVTSHVH